MDEITETKVEEALTVSKQEISRRRIMGIPDIFIVLIILCLSVGAYIYFNAIAYDATTAVVAKNKTEIYRIDLTTVTEPYDLIIDKENNVVLYIESDGVSMKSSDCKDHTCINTGKISKDGEAIVCLPYAYTVFIEGGAINDVDAVVG